MNCCDDYGNCTRGKDCPARPAMLSDTGPIWFVRALDWVGNQWDKLNALSQVCAVVAGVAICFAVAVAAVG